MLRDKEGRDLLVLARNILQRIELELDTDGWTEVQQGGMVIGFLCD